MSDVNNSNQRFGIAAALGTALLLGCLSGQAGAFDYEQRLLYEWRDGDLTLIFVKTKKAGNPDRDDFPCEQEKEKQEELPPDSMAGKLEFELANNKPVRVRMEDLPQVLETKRKAKDGMRFQVCVNGRFQMLSPCADLKPGSDAGFESTVSMPYWPVNDSDIPAACETQSHSGDDRDHTHSDSSTASGTQVILHPPYRHCRAVIGGKVYYYHCL